MRTPRTLPVLSAGVLAAGLLLVTGPAGPARAGAQAWSAQTWSVPATGLAITGHGYGHGHGLGQYGAQGAALRGVLSGAILDHYYPGTVAGALPGPATVRVLLTADTDDDVTVRADPGLVLSDADGASWVLPAGASAWRVTADGAGAQHVALLAAGTWQPWAAPGGRSAFVRLTFSGPARLRLDLPGGSGRAYRGTLTAAPAGGAALDTVDTLPFEQYLYGVVPSESPASWLPAALQAQAVAARTYAAYLRSGSTGRAYDICDTTSCQVYGGSASYGSSGALAELEHASTNAAVDATAGSVRLYAGRLAFTQFSASTGGWGSSGSQPYLSAAPDPWDDFPGNPVHTWTAVLTPAALAAAYPSLGTVRSVTVLARDGNGEWGGRTTSVQLQGSSAGGAPTSLTVSGSDLAGRLGLRSPWWTVAQESITDHWLSLGGAAGFLGAPTGPEHDVPGGRAQEFAGGTIFSSPATDPHEVHGELLRRYAALGGPGGPVGLPTSDEQPIPGGATGTFTGGTLYWSGVTGAQWVHGRVLDAYLAAGGPLGRLGLPLDEEQPHAAGVRERFQAGNVYWSGATDAQPVEGTVLARYVVLGEGYGPLGLPTAPESAVTGGRAALFATGRIYASPTTGTHEVLGSILERYLAAGGPDGLLGLPTSGERPAAGGRVETFTGGSVYWTVPTGARIVRGQVLAAYRGLGQAGGLLGWPVDEESPSVPGAVVQHFGGGEVLWSGPTGAHEVHGLIRVRYDELGGPGGLLGLPVGDEAPAGAVGRRSGFVLGTLYWSPSTGTHEVHGLILARYVALGAASSALGLPVTDEYAVPGGRRSDFVGGSLVWSAATGRVSQVPR